MSDVFCLPSRSEGFSNALLEAMACALPCVATRVGGNAEAIEDGVSGFLVAPQDPDLIADRLLRLLRQPEAGRHMGQAARQRVEEKFTVEAMMANLTAVYDGLLGSADLASPAARVGTSHRGGA
jgi:glycosyltransferase involved in cell wall biosynthesis